VGGRAAGFDPAISVRARSSGDVRAGSGKGEIGWSDLKLSELVCLADGILLVLERGSETTKIYRVRPADDLALNPVDLDVATRPSVEELSGAGQPLPSLPKQLLFSTDAAPQVSADLEGMAVLSATELLLSTTATSGRRARRPPSGK